MSFQQPVRAENRIGGNRGGLADVCARGACAVGLHWNHSKSCDELYLGLPDTSQLCRSLCTSGGHHFMERAAQLEDLRNRVVSWHLEWFAERLRFVDSLCRMPQRWEGFSGYSSRSLVSGSYYCNGDTLSARADPGARVGSHSAVDCRSRGPLL